MAYDLPLPAHLRNVGWRVKIRDKEIREPPHVTVIRKTIAWRIDLRTRQFMDTRPNPSDIPPELIRIVEYHWTLVCQQWDAMYPNNPVADHEV